MFEVTCRSASFRKTRACWSLFHFCFRRRRTSLRLIGSSIPSHRPKLTHISLSLSVIEDELEILSSASSLDSLTQLIISVVTNVIKSDGISNSSKELLLVNLDSRIKISVNSSLVKISCLVLVSLDEIRSEEQRGILLHSFSR